jgi:gamma-glutamyltranspeptidase/glutathione hydrolase
MYLDASGNPTRDSIEGWRAAGVPGTVRGFEFAHRKYGRMAWKDLVAPAVELASRGFPVSVSFGEQLQRRKAALARDPESRRILLGGGAGYRAGERLIQPELARTLSRIAQLGAKDFYEGETARTLADAMAKNGGLITLADLQKYAAVERTPLEGRYRGYGVVTAPPPSAGGVALLQVLGMLEGSGYQKSGAGSAPAIHYTAEALRRAFADRSRYLGDPGFSKIPVDALVDREYLRKRRAEIDPGHATPSARVFPGKLDGHEGAETTHYSIVDAQGTAVAVTYTLNDGFGSGVTVPGLGFLLNDEMDDFTARPGAPNLFGVVQGEVNAIAPGKRPASSMTPTIVTRGGKLFLVVGAPGGARIVSAVLQVILNAADFGMNIQDAVDFPRFHHQWLPDKLYLENGFAPAVIARLKNMGHDVDEAPGVVPPRVHAIASQGGWLQGGADRRADGKAAGY